MLLAAEDGHCRRQQSVHEFGFVLGFACPQRARQQRAKCIGKLCQQRDALAVLQRLQTRHHITHRQLPCVHHNITQQKSTGQS